MFMGMLVGLTKAGLCYCNHHSINIGGTLQLIKASSWELSLSSQAPASGGRRDPGSEKSDISY